MNRRLEKAEKVEKPGRLELAIIEWQRQLVGRRKAETASWLESASSGGDSRSTEVQDHSAAA